jgi:hypothetical protein
MVSLEDFSGQALGKVRANVELEIVEGQAHKNHVIDQNKKPVEYLEKAQAGNLVEMQGVGQGYATHGQSQNGQKDSCMSDHIFKISEKYKGYKVVVAALPF